MGIVIEENVLLSRYTTFRTGGLARYFVNVHTKEEIEEAFAFGTDKNIPVRILGGGSNVVIPDEGFSGLVVHSLLKGIAIEDKNTFSEVTLFSGEIWDDAVVYVLNKNLRGLENLSGIPGSVGGAVVQNIGAYGRELKDILLRVSVYDPLSRKFFNLSEEECEFGYRQSIFKKEKNKHLVVISVTVRVSDTLPLELSYRDLETYFTNNKKEEITPTRIREAVLLIRSQKLPNLKEYGSAGSFFKNPIISKNKAHELQKKFPALPRYPMGNEAVKVSAGYLIDIVAGAKNVSYGGASVYKDHALVLVTQGMSQSQDIFKCAEEITKRVFEKTNITLEREVEYFI